MTHAVTGEPLRVLFVSHSFPPPGRPLANVGGMQRVATELHAALARHPGVALHERVLRTSWRWTHVRVIPFLAGLLTEIPHVVRREGIDVVLFSSAVTATLAPRLRRVMGEDGPRLAAITHGLDVTTPTALWQRRVRRSMAALDAVFPVSRATADECLARGAAPARVRVLPNGVDVARFPAVTDRVAARAELLASLGVDAGPDALLLCSVGRHVARKGFAWFAGEVLPRLPADARWLLAGEGPETPAVRAAARAAGVEERVRVLGRVPEETLATMLRGGDLFVMPNVPVADDLEGFGVVMLEAGLCGMPVVASRLEGILDAVTEGENGRLVPARDAAAFAEAVVSLGGDRAGLADASRRAREFVAGRFSWPAVADGYVAALRSVVASDEVESDRRA